MKLHCGKKSPAPRISSTPDHADTRDQVGRDFPPRCRRIEVTVQLPAILSNRQPRVSGLSFGPDGNLYVDRYTPGDIYRINVQNGKATGATRLSASRPLVLTDAIRPLCDQPAEDSLTCVDLPRNFCRFLGLGKQPLRQAEDLTARSGARRCCREWHSNRDIRHEPSRRAPLPRAGACPEETRAARLRSRSHSE
jgi:hypothetical protein